MVTKDEEDPTGRRSGRPLPPGERPPGSGDGWVTLADGRVLWGRYGAAGMLQLRGAGWRTIAQDQATSVVWGMPGAAVALGAAERTLPMSAIAGAVTECMAARPAGGAR